MSNKLARAPGQTKAFWLDHIKQWRSSGLSKATYCQQHNLKAGNFYNWCSKESSHADTKAPGRRAAALKFIPVSIADPVTRSATVTLQVGGATFGFPAEISADDIDRWLSAIERQRV